MRKALLVVLILSSALAWAQGGCTGQKPLNGMTTGGFLKGVTNASVRVCSDTLTPCTTIPLYSDPALTQSISNPVTTDATGNYQYCAAAGSYNEQISGSAFSTVNNTPVTISGSGDVASGGNNVLTGTNDFRLLDNTYITTPAIDSALYGNECAAINAAWAYALSKGWAGVHIVSGWHGVQACGTSDPNANYPSVINANPPTFAAVLDMQPDNIIQSDQSVVLRTNQHWDFHNPHSGLGATANAIVGGFQSSNAFTTGAVVEFGAPDGTSVTSGGQPQGVQLENAGVYCRGPNGTFRSGSIGVRNQYSQEQSWGKNLRVDGCQYGIDKQDSGAGFGSENDGPWEDLHLNVGGANTANAQCIRIGAAGSSNANAQNSRGFYHISCNTNGATVQPNWGVTLDGVGIPVVDLHTEGFLGAIGCGETGYCKGNPIRDVTCIALGSFTIGTCVDIGSANQFGNTSGNTIINVSTSGTAIHGFCDNMALGGCTTPAVTPTLAFYAHSGGTIISTSSEILSRMSFATGPTLNAVGAPTANAVFSMGGFQMQLAGSTTQNTPIFNIQGGSGNTHTPFLLNVSTGSGSSEKAYSFATNGKSIFSSDGNGNPNLTTLCTATASAPCNSTFLLTQGQWWDGAAAQAQNLTPQITYSPSSGTTTSATYKDIFGNAGSLVMLRDFSNWAKVLAKNISTGTASNTDLAGTIAISASTTGTYTFAQTYASAPICTLTPTADPTATGVYWATATTTVLTANVKTSGTITFNYQCIGRN